MEITGKETVSEAVGKLTELLTQANQLILNSRLCIISAESNRDANRLGCIHVFGRDIVERFPDNQQIEYTDRYNKVFAMVNGVEVFSLVDRA